MIELSLLKLLLTKDTFLAAQEQGLSTTDFPKELVPFYSVLSNYFAQNDETLTVDDLGNLLFASTTKDKEYNLAVLQNLKSLESSDKTASMLLQRVLMNKKLKQLSLSAYEAYEGKLDIEKFLPLLDEFKIKETVDDGEEFEFVSDSLAILVDAAVSTPGLRWRLQTLNRMLGSLRKGNFGFVFARPETGKTTFLASEVSFMCSQLSADDGPIIWIANEEPGENVKLRIYQAWFGIGMAELLSNIPMWEARFVEESKGKVKVFDRAIVHKNLVEKMCAKLKPSLIIFDQIDKIVGFDNDREDLRLGSIYQWARGIAKLYAPVIGICQADGTAEGVKWITMGHVANAKTAKQAEADWILGIGRSNDSGFEDIRFFHLSKNKLLGDADTEPKHRHGKLEVQIAADIARYKDLY